MNAIVILSFSCLWTGTRIFSGLRSGAWQTTLAGPTIWLVLCQFPAFYASFPARIATFSLLVAGLTLCAARELSRPVNRDLFLCRLTTSILYIHSGLLISRILVAHLLHYSFNFEQAPLWFTLYAIEPVLFSIATGLCLIALVKERSELRERRIAAEDGLTGVSNRRGFIEHAEDLAVGLRHTASCGAMLLFDLDNFKRINDSFGHPAGDRMLRLFAKVTSDNLRRSDAVGRIGGEEFAAFLPGADVAGARRNADRIRLLFRDAVAASPDRETQATVSVGVAVATGNAILIDSMMRRADRALYRAKSDGRDRVAVDLGDDRPDDAPPMDQERASLVPSGLPLAAGPVRLSGGPG
ncbi:GGDEF domain-containing protein [Segnochrobactraceae bacterium EtOH-i3]